MMSGSFVFGTNGNINKLCFVKSPSSHSHLGKHIYPLKGEFRASLFWDISYTESSAHDVGTNS